MNNDGNGEIIDVEAEEIVESDNLPAVIEREASSAEGPSTESPEETDELGRAWRDKVLKANPERRCSARLSDGSGQQCRKWAIRGGTTCATHGSGTKAAKLAAQARLDNSADRMVAHLLRLAKYAESEAIQLKATDSAIDRTLGRATQQVVLSQGNRAYEEVFDEIIAGGSREESRARRGYSPESEPDSYSSRYGESSPALVDDLGKRPGSRSDGAGAEGSASLRPERVRRREDRLSAPHHRRRCARGRGRPGATEGHREPAQAVSQAIAPQVVNLRLSGSSGFRVH